MRALRKVTYDFTRGEVGTPPSGGVSGTTIVAFSPDAVRELGRRVISVTDEIIGRSLVVLRLVRRPKVLHGARGDWVGGRGISVGRRVRLGVPRAVVMWRGRLMVETVGFGGSVSCLHYDLIWMRRRGIKVPLLLLLLLLRLLLRELERGGGVRRGRRTDATDGYLRGGRGETWKSDP